MEWLTNSRRSRRSDEQLRDLYAELLLHINAAKQALQGRQQADPIRLSQTRRRRSSLRRSLVSTVLGDRPSPTSPVKVRDLATAFHVLSATPNPYQEGINGGAVAVREKGTVAALSTARAKESHVVTIIRRIGELVAYGDQPGTTLRSDPIFEYFCEKDMMALLVDIARSQPQKGRPPTDLFHEVVWSPHVKAQVLQTVSVLVSNTQDAPSLYYLLSNNHLNNLVISMRPLSQWSNPALEEMLPVYSGLLKNLGVQVSSSPDLFSFLTIKSPESPRPLFPVFSAAVEVLTSPFAQSNSHVHDTSLGLLLGLMRISDPSIRSWISGAVDEHRKLAMYMCQRLVDRYDRLSMLTTGPVVDPVRSKAVAGQLAVLQREIESLNDILWCGIRTLNVRICECLLQRLVGLLLRNLIPTERLHFLAVGSTDFDVIPGEEALAQASIVVLTKLFLLLAYAPVLRMLAVAVFHPLSSTIWNTSQASISSSSEEYVLTKVLNGIVTQQLEAKNVPLTEDASLDHDIVSNPYRKEILSILRGREGEWRFIAASLLVESALVSEALDLDLLISLKLTPQFTEKERKQYPPSVLEDAIVDFFKSRQLASSFISSLAFERAGSLSLALLEHVELAMRQCGWNSSEMSRSLVSPLMKNLKRMRSHYFAVAWSFKEQSGISQLYVDLLQLVIASRYQRLVDDGAVQGHLPYGCPLEKFTCRHQSENPDILIRKYRNVSTNDVEDARFAMKMALHFRALCRVLEDGFSSGMVSRTQSAGKTGRKWTSMIERADDLLLEIGDLKEKPPLGTDLDLRGRMTFRFFAASKSFEQRKPKSTVQPDENRQRTLSEDMLLRPTTQLVLVLDPTDLFVVKPINRSDINRGTIVCRASLRSVIACASDGEWCHVAIRNMPNIGFLVKNGNMALRFESVGTCLIVRQYLERSQSALRYELMEKVRSLFEKESQTSSENAQSEGHVTGLTVVTATARAEDGKDENAVTV